MYMYIVYIHMYLCLVLLSELAHEPAGHVSLTHRPQLVGGVPEGSRGGRPVEVKAHQQRGDVLGQTKEEVHTNKVQELEEEERGGGEY